MTPDAQLLRSILLSASVVLSFLFFPYGLNFYVLLRRASEYRVHKPRNANKYPVTIQLPVYNERYVVNRIVDACIRMADHYGRSFVQILVLDDSTDDTTEIARRIVSRYRAQGYDIRLIRRDSRAGFKAGALQNALKSTKHPYIAVFDADFVPPEDFLDRVMPYFEDERLSMVQCRWSHINRDYNSVTRAISIGYDGHHVVEQAGRYAGGYLINFNGSAGVIRRRALEEAGGWQSDTLAEDLDLSYRMQLAGWRALYLRDVECPAEIPPTVPAIKKQQSRWASGSIRTFRKLALRLLRDSRLRLGQKLEGVVHLSFYSVHPLMLSAYLVAVVAAIFNIRLIEFEPRPPPPPRLPIIPVAGIESLSAKAIWEGLISTGRFIAEYIASLIFALWRAVLFMPQWVVLNVAILFCAVAMWIFYSEALRVQGMVVRRHVRPLATLLLIGFGISISNTISVAKGFFGRKAGIFSRTPKYKIERLDDTWRDKKYQIRISWVVLLEIAAGVIGIISMIKAYLSEPAPNLGIMPILLLYTVAYLYVAKCTIKESVKGSVIQTA